MPEEKHPNAVEKFLLEQKAVGPSPNPHRRSAEPTRRGDQGFRRQAGEARAQIAGRQAETEPSQAAGTGGRGEPEGQAEGITALVAAILPEPIAKRCQALWET
jgi:hypothetical protein